jgi:hypothetical protein
MAVYDVDPYVRPGDPRSGLLPLLHDIAPRPGGLHPSRSYGTS